MLSVKNIFDVLLYSCGAGVDDSQAMKFGRLINDMICQHQPVVLVYILHVDNCGAKKTINNTNNHSGTGP